MKTTSIALASLPLVVGLTVLTGAAPASAATSAPPSSYDGMRLTVRSTFFAPDAGTGPTCTVEMESTGRAALELPEAVVAFTAPGGRIIARANDYFIRPTELLPGMRVAGTVSAPTSARAATGCRVLSTSSASTYQLPDTAYRTIVQSDTVTPGLGLRKVSGTVTNTGRGGGGGAAVTLTVRDSHGTVRYVASSAIKDVPRGRTVGWETTLDPNGPAGQPGDYSLEARVDASSGLTATHDVGVLGPLPKTFRRGTTAGIEASLGGGAKAGSNAGATLILVQVLGGSTRRIASATTDRSGVARLAVPTRASGRYLVYWPGLRGGVPGASRPFDVRITG